MGPYSYLERLLLTTTVPDSSQADSLALPRPGPVPRPPRDLAVAPARFT